VSLPKNKSKFDKVFLVISFLVVIFSIIVIFYIADKYFLLIEVYGDSFYDFQKEQYKNDPTAREKSRSFLGAVVDLPLDDDNCLQYSDYTYFQRTQLFENLMKIKGTDSKEENEAKGIVFTILNIHCPHLIFFVIPEKVVNLPVSEIDSPYSYEQIKNIFETESPACNRFGNPDSGFQSIQEQNAWNYCMNYVLGWNQNELEKTDLFLEKHPNYFKSQEKNPVSFVGGCLIATATYGSELSPQVQQLRELRDNSLLQTASGASFMNSFNQFYYSFSPTIADWERESPLFKEAVKVTLTPLISSLSILNYVDMDSETSVLGYGISLILLNVGMYFVAPAMIIHTIRKKF